MTMPFLVSTTRPPTGEPPKAGRIGPMRRGEMWFAATPGGDRPVFGAHRAAGQLRLVAPAVVRAAHRTPPPISARSCRLQMRGFFTRR